MFQVGVDLWPTAVLLNAAGGGGGGFASYALALDFAHQSYWANGVNYPALSSAPGYAFTRTGTQGAVDSDGGVDWFGINSLLRSQEFDNAGVWTLENGPTLAANAIAAPDGTMTADKLASVAGGLSYNVYQLFASTPAPWTVSIFAKAAELNWLCISLFDSSPTLRHAWFNLATATIGTKEGGVATSCTPLANGWCRCTLVMPSAFSGAGNTVRFGFTDGDNNTFTSAPGRGGYLWQAQAVLGSIANGGPVIATGAAVASAPAINGNGYHAYAALTNNLLRSQELDFGGSWTSFGLVTPNAIAAPDGTTTADKLIEDGGTGFHPFIQTVALTGQMTFLMLAKAAERSKIRMLIEGTVTGSGVFADFDLIAGTFGGGNGIVSATGVTAGMVALGSGYYLCAVACNPGGGDTAVNCTVRLLQSAGVQNYPGTPGFGAYFWQMQLVAGTYVNGAPLIATGAAAAGIGANQLSATVNPIVSDVDFAWWAVASIQMFDATYHMFAAMGGNTYIGILGGLFLLNDGPGEITGGTAVLGRNVVGMRRRAGKTTLFYKPAGGASTVGVESAVRAWPATTTAFYAGCWATGNIQANYPVESTFIKLGTFSDAEITAILDAA